MKYLPTKLKIWLLKKLYQDVSSKGREGDCELAHVNTWEANLLMAHGGSGTINPMTGLREYKGGGGGTQTTTSELDPTVKPFVQYGLEESKRLYQTPGPSYYPGQTYVDPSATTQSALQAATARATAGSPLLPAAQAQQLNTIQGGNLGLNPYFSAALQGAGGAATRQFQDAIQSIGSRAAQAGRYGSGAMGDLESRASQNLAETLANKAGELAYADYGRERGIQEAAIANAPQMAQADYADIQNLLATGKTEEDYSRQALQADIDRFSFEQNLPYSKLQSYLSGAYGAPAPIQQTSTSSGGGK